MLHSPPCWSPQLLLQQQLLPHLRPSRLWPRSKMSSPPTQWTASFRWITLACAVWCRLGQECSEGSVWCRFGPHGHPRQSSDCDEPLPLSVDDLPLSAALVTVPRALQRMPLRLGLLCSPTAVATALASITGARHLREPAAAFRDLRSHPTPYPVLLNEAFGESELPRSSHPGLRVMTPLLPSP